MASQNKTNLNRARVAGGLTLFTFGGQPIAFCNMVTETSVSPVGAGFEEIHPMDEPYASEIVVAPAARAGSIVLEMFELFGQGKTSKIWDRLGGSYTSQTATGNEGAGGLYGNFGEMNGAVYSSIGSQGLFNGAVDIVDVFIRQAQLEPNQVMVTKYIRPIKVSANPTNSSISSGKEITEPYFQNYHGCVITNIEDGETDEIGSLAVLKRITLMYRYTDRDGTPSQAFALRDNSL